MSGRQFSSHQPKTFKAAGDLSGANKRYSFVKMSAANEVTTAGAGETAVGVQQNEPNAAGKPTVVALCGAGGGTKLRIGAAVSAGDKLKSDASGRGVAAATGNEYFAIANEAGAAANEVVEAMLQVGQVP